MLEPTPAFENKELEDMLSELPDPTEVEIKFSDVTKYDNTIIGGEELLSIYGPFGTKLPVELIRGSCKFKLKNPSKKDIFNSLVYIDKDHKIFFGFEKAVWEKDHATIELTYYDIKIYYSGSEPEWISKFKEKLLLKYDHSTGLTIYPRDLD